MIKHNILISCFIAVNNGYYNLNLIDELSALISFNKTHLASLHQSMSFNSKLSLDLLKKIELAVFGTPELIDERLQHYSKICTDLIRSFGSIKDSTKRSSEHFNNVKIRYDRLNEKTTQLPTSDLIAVALKELVDLYNGIVTSFFGQKTMFSKGSTTAPKILTQIQLTVKELCDFPISPSILYSTDPKTSRIILITENLEKIIANVKSLEMRKEQFSQPTNDHSPSPKSGRGR